MRGLAILNRWAGYALVALAAVLAGVGLFLGAFAWLNDSLVAGVRLAGTTGAFAAAFAAAGWLLQVAARAHERADRRRWWIQIGALVSAYVFFGLAATASSLLDRLG